MTDKLDLDAAISTNKLREVQVRRSFTGGWEALVITDTHAFSGTGNSPTEAIGAALVKRFYIEGKKEGD